MEGECRRGEGELAGEGARKEAPPDKQTAPADSGFTWSAPPTPHTPSPLAPAEDIASRLPTWYPTRHCPPAAYLVPGTPDTMQPGTGHHTTPDTVPDRTG